MVSKVAPTGPGATALGSVISMASSSPVCSLRTGTPRDAQRFSGLFDLNLRAASRVPVGELDGGHRDMDLTAHAWRGPVRRRMRISFPTRRSSDLGGRRII